MLESTMTILPTTQTAETKTLMSPRESPIFLVHRIMFLLLSASMATFRFSSAPQEVLMSNTEIIFVMAITELI